MTYRRHHNGFIYDETTGRKLGQIDAKGQEQIDDLVYLTGLTPTQLTNSAGAAYASFSVTGTDTQGRPTGILINGVAYTVAYTNGVISSVVGDSKTKTITYPNGLLNVAVA